jgi:hypothetical protein
MGPAFTATHRLFTVCGLLDLSQVSGLLLTVYNCIKLQVDLQADKSPIVVKGPFFPRVVNPRYRIRGTMRDARLDLLKPMNLDLQEVKPMHSIKEHHKNESNLLKTGGSK